METEILFLIWPALTKAVLRRWGGGRMCPPVHYPASSTDHNVVILLRDKLEQQNGGRNSVVEHHTSYP